MRIFIPWTETTWTVLQYLEDKVLVVANDGRLTGKELIFPRYHEDYVYLPA
ncbi:hypothetical protein GJ688_02750 [Heliobacillus mobilis]|uniref:Uncharacterized protein n=1 Tax=Heliobacterium mobile TaxID=28064 RepID=A0A6I3SGE8_HELMO|nr:hypothetical protein [Heliobacterium mobile]MTV47901.1 hypothetical protein [Heliobacterium mobile]